jgi:Rhamnan synthesis protein F
MTTYRYAILYHNYYAPGGIDDIRDKISALPSRDTLLLCSLPDKFADLYPLQRENEKFIIAPNVGKDIGGKLILMDLLLTLYPDVPYAILLHDKRSYQKHSGRWERDGLFSIINPAKFGAIAATFEDDPRLGIACAAGNVRNEYLGDGEFNTHNSALLQQLIEQYAIPDQDLRFVAGTMFWIRTALLREFFSTGRAGATGGSSAGRNTTLEVRATLETGNVLDHEKGTLTHCWERLFSWIALRGNYNIGEF